MVIKSYINFKAECSIKIKSEDEPTVFKYTFQFDSWTNKSWFVNNLSSSFWSWPPAVGHWFLTDRTTFTSFLSISRRDLAGPNSSLFTFRLVVLTIPMPFYLLFLLTRVTFGISTHVHICASDMGFFFYIFSIFYSRTRYGLMGALWVWVESLMK